MAKKGHVFTAEEKQAADDFKLITRALGRVKQTGGTPIWDWEERLTENGGEIIDRDKMWEDFLAEKARMDKEGTPDFMPKAHMWPEFLRLKNKGYGPTQ